MVKKVLEINDDEIRWLLNGLYAAEVENLVPKTKSGGQDERVRALEKKLKTLLYQPKKKSHAS